ncbi:MAG: hypothetical protein KF878_35225 [Planctomycetes bacterium]|nr:hypothetical protein [Planctomycetota bacterium]
MPVTGPVASALRDLRADPDARPDDERLSGGLVWPDETSPALLRACLAAPPEERHLR